MAKTIGGLSSELIEAVTAGYRSELIPSLRNFLGGRVTSIPSGLESEFGQAMEKLTSDISIGFGIDAGDIAGQMVGAAEGGLIIGKGAEIFKGIRDLIEEKEHEQERVERFEYVDNALTNHPELIRPLPIAGGVRPSERTEADIIHELRQRQIRAGRQSRGRRPRPPEFKFDDPVRVPETDEPVGSIELGDMADQEVEFGDPLPEPEIQRPGRDIPVFPRDTPIVKGGRMERPTPIRQIPTSGGVRLTQEQKDALAAELGVPSRPTTMRPLPVDRIRVVRPTPAPTRPTPTPPIPFRPTTGPQQQFQPTTGPQQQVQPTPTPAPTPTPTPAPQIPIPIPIPIPTIGSGVGGTIINNIVNGRKSNQKMRFTRQSNIGMGPINITRRSEANHNLVSNFFNTTF